MDGVERDDQQPGRTVKGKLLEITMKSLADICIGKAFFFAPFSIFPLASVPSKVVLLFMGQTSGTCRLYEGELDQPTVNGSIHVMSTKNPNTDPTVRVRHLVYRNLPEPEHPSSILTGQEYIAGSPVNLQSTGLLCMKRFVDQRHISYL